MAEDKFLLISLEEEKTKKLVNVISSETSRKILNLLSEKDCSKTEISKKMNIPLTTVDYNIEQLEKAGLIESKEFKWSEKGKKVNYYRPVNKFIVIAPKQNDFSSILKNILPVTLISVTISGIIYYFQNNPFAQMVKVSLESTPMLESSIATQPNLALYFLMGVLTVSVLYSLMKLLFKK